MNIATITPISKTEIQTEEEDLLSVYDKIASSWAKRAEHKDNTLNRNYKNQ